jgi:hypothetical protein
MSYKSSEVNMTHITNIAFSKPMLLHLEFDNSKNATIDMNEFASGDFLQKLRDFSFFTDGDTSANERQVEWPDGSTFCADALYLKAFGTLPKMSNLGYLDNE